MQSNDSLGRRASANRASGARHSCRFSGLTIRCVLSIWLLCGVRPVFGHLLGRRAPAQGYAALAQWAQDHFGANAPLAVRLNLTSTNTVGIRRIVDTASGIDAG